MGLLSALEVGRSAIQASQLALEVTGHNMANAATEGYARQRPILTAQPGQQTTPGLIAGTGVRVTEIQALVNHALNDRVRTAVSESNDAQIRHTYLSRLESILNELSDESLSSAINEFFNAVQDLASNPSDIGLRGLFVQRADNLATTFTSLQARLGEAWLEVDGQITASVEDINAKAARIADLNEAIIRQEQAGAGGTANDLRGQRTVLLEELAALVDIRTVEGPTGDVSVLIGNDMLLQRDRVREVSTVVETGHGFRRTGVVFADDGGAVRATVGALAALADSRDGTIGGLIDDLDRLAAALIEEINRVHSVGSGLTPLTAVTSAEAVDDPDAALNAAGLHVQPTHGHFDIRVIEQGTGLATTTAVDVDLDGLGSDTTLNDLAGALDAVDGITASVDSRNRLVIEADSAGLGFGFGDDTSGVLAALGINTLFTGYDSRSMAVSAPVLADSARVCAGRSSAPDDGSNLAGLLAVRSTTLASLDGLTPGDFLQSTSTTLAGRTASALDAYKTADVFRGTLFAEREAHRGVNLDEEALQLIRYQRMFQGAARVIQTADELLRLLIEL